MIMIMTPLSNAMTHHETSGPLFHRFLPVTLCTLGQVSGRLVAVGGMKKGNEVKTHNEQFRKWEETFPLMPTAIYSSGFLSLQSAIVVSGGIKLSPNYACTAAVEMYKPDTSQWYRTNPLPTAYRDVSLVAIGNTCYALGGYNDLYIYLSQALYVSVDYLLGNTVAKHHPQW